MGGIDIRGRARCALKKIVNSKKTNEPNKIHVAKKTKLKLDIGNKKLGTGKQTFAISNFYKLMHSSFLEKHTRFAGIELFS